MGVDLMAGQEKITVVGAGLGGLIAAHVSGYRALVLERGVKLNTNFADMVGARFLHDSPELRGLFSYQGPAATAQVSSDAADPEAGLEQYTMKTRRCRPSDIPPTERESVMNWGQGSFDFLPLALNAWCAKVADRAGVLLNADVTGVDRQNGKTVLQLANGGVAVSDRVIFTIPLPVMLRITGFGGKQFRSYPHTVGRFRIHTHKPMPTTMHYVTSLSTPISRITTRDSSVIVEAPANQDAKLIGLMTGAAEGRASELVGPGGRLETLGFGTFLHHFAYFRQFEEFRKEALAVLATMGLQALGRYALWSHRVKTRETYLRAKELLT